MKRQEELSVDKRLQGFLVVDDDEIFAGQFVNNLVASGYRDVRHADTHRCAVTMLEAWAPARAVVEMSLPGRSGFQLLGSIRTRSPSTMVLLHTTAPSRAVTRDAVRLGAIDCASKTSIVRRIEYSFSLAERSAYDVRPSDIGIPSLERVVWEHIQLVLARCDGNLSRAARILGITRNTLKARLGSVPPPELAERLEAAAALDFDIDSMRSN